MNFLTNINISEKIRRIVLLITSIAMLLATLAYVGFQTHAYRQALVKQVSVLANIISINSLATIPIGDEYTAQILLNSLELTGYVHAAIIYKDNWQEFATFEIDSHMGKHLKSANEDWKQRPLAYKEVRYGYSGSHLTLVTPVNSLGKNIGYVAILSNLAPLYSQILDFL